MFTSEDINIQRAAKLDAFLRSMNKEARATFGREVEHLTGENRWRGKPSVHGDMLEFLGRFLILYGR